MIPDSYKWAWASLAFLAAGMACITKAVVEEHKERQMDDKWLKATLSEQNESSSSQFSPPPPQSSSTESD